MGNYLSDFKNNTNFKEIESLIPSVLCPFLFYNLTPYIYTLIKGGWFDWIKKNNDPTYRKKIDIGDFSKKNVNRLYANEVLVRCPNPYITVVAGVGLWNDKSIKIRILYSKGDCPNNHKQNDEISLYSKDIEYNIFEYNRLFPEVLSLSIAGKSCNESGRHCIKEGKLSIETSRIIFPCRYHKKTRMFNGSFLPENFCPHVFSLIYPHILAVMYNARIGKRIKIKHPGQDAYITLSIEKVSLLNNYLRSILNLLKSIFKSIFYPIDILDYNLVINVIENEISDCQLKKENKYYVNLRNKNFICPASFHVLFPFLLLASLGHGIKWDSSKENDLLPCPDCIGTVYTISRNIA